LLIEKSNATKQPATKINVYKRRTKLIFMMQAKGCGTAGAQPEQSSAPYTQRVGFGRLFYCGMGKSEKLKP